MPLFQKIAYLDGVVNLVSTVTKCLDFSSASVPGVISSGRKKPSPSTTPMNWDKQMHKQMGNFTSLVKLIAKLLMACHDYGLEKVIMSSSTLKENLYLQKACNEQVTILAW